MTLTNIPSSETPSLKRAQLSFAKVVQATKELHSAISEVVEIQARPNTSEHMNLFPALSLLPYSSIAAQVKTLSHHLDSLNDLNLALAGAITIATHRGELSSPHASTSISEYLHLPQATARNLLATWEATYTRPRTPTITPSLITDALSLDPTNEPLSAEEQSSIESDGTELEPSIPTSEANSDEDQNNPERPQLTPLSLNQLTTEQHKLVSLQRVREQKRRQQQQDQNNVLIADCVRNRVMTAAARNTMLSIVSSLKDTAPASKQDVIAETLAWARSQRAEYLQTCKNQGCEPSPEFSLNVDEVSKFIRARIRELNDKAEPTLRSQARAGRSLTIGQPNSENLVPLRAQLPPEVAANLKSLLSIHSTYSNNNPDSSSERDTRTISQRQADGFNRIVDDAANHYRKVTKAAPKSPRAMVNFAVEKSELDTINHAALIIEALSQHTKPLTSLITSTSDDTATPNHAPSITMASSSPTPPEDSIQLDSSLQLNSTAVHRIEELATAILGETFPKYSEQEHQKPYLPPSALSESQHHPESSGCDFDSELTNTEFSDKSSAGEHPPERSLYHRLDLDPEANPPGSIHPRQAQLLRDAANKVKSNRLEAISPVALRTAINLLLTHTFETNTGISLTLDELSRLGIADSYYLCGVSPKDATVVSLQSQRRGGGELFRAIKTIEQGVCAKPGSTMASVLCDLHHIQAWADGGSTDFDNLTLVSRSNHCANDDTKTNPNKGHFARHPKTKIVGWVEPYNKDKTLHVFTNGTPQALRAPARRMLAERTQKGRHRKREETGTLQR